MKLTKTQQWTIAIVAVILIALLIWWFLRKKKPQVDPTPLQPTPPATPTENTSPNAPADHDIMLRRGDRSEQVKTLQRYINRTLQERNKEYRVELLTIDGIFGAKTEGWLDILHQINVITYGQFRTIEALMK